MKPEESKTPPEQILKESTPSELLQNAMKAEPQFASNQEAVKSLSEQLEKLAGKLQLSVDQLLNVAEHSAAFREEHLLALKLSRQISYFSRK